MEKYGIENLKKAGEGVLKTLDLVDDVLEDGKVNLADAPKIMDLPSVIEKFTGLKNVGREALDLSEAEAEGLKEHFKSYASSLIDDLGDDKLEVIAGMVLTIAINISESISLFTKKAA